MTDGNECEPLDAKEHVVGHEADMRPDRLLSTVLYFVNAEQDSDDFFKLLLVLLYYPVLRVSKFHDISKNPNAIFKRSPEQISDLPGYTTQIQQPVAT